MDTQMRWMKLDRRAMFTFVSALSAVLAFAPASAQDVELPERLTGVWQGTVTVGPYDIGGEIIFQPNGTFRRTNWLNGLMTWASGPYTIARNWIHFEVEAYGPEIYLNVPQPKPPSETWMVDFFDGRVIDARLADGSVIHYERQD
jgi:hypothetical protein